MLAQSTTLGDILSWVGIGVGLLIVVVGIFFFLAFGKLWIQAWSSGCPIPVGEFIGMFLRKVNPQLITDMLVTATKAGIPLDIDKLQSHVLARGNIRRSTAS